MKTIFFKAGLISVLIIGGMASMKGEELTWTEGLTMTFNCVADNGATIYMAPKQIKGLYPIFTPTDSYSVSNYGKITCELTEQEKDKDEVVASVYKVNYWQPKANGANGTDRVQFYELHAYRPGTCKLTVKVPDPAGKEEAWIKEYNIVVGYDNYTTPENGFVDGTILLNEEWYGHTNGGLNYLTPDNEIIYQVYEHENPGEGFGATSQFGTIWADKLFVVSKQPSDGGDPLPGGGHLVIADAKTLKKFGNVYKLEYNGATGDGRAVAGATKDKVYVTTSNGIFIVDITNPGSPEVIGRIGVDEENSDLYTGQMGDIINGGRYVYAVKQATGVFIIDPETDLIVKTITNATVQGITQTSDGTVWYVATEEGCSKLYPINPNTLEEGEVITLPSSLGTITCSWGAWRTTAFKGAYSGNDIWFITGGGGITGGSSGGYYKYHIGDDPNELTPLTSIAELEGEPAEIPETYAMKNYGTPIFDPRNNQLLLFTSSNGASGHYRNNWLFLIDSETGETKKSIFMEPYYWFPAHAIIPDKYLPALNNENFTIELSMENPEEDIINLYEIISDKDNILSNIKFLSVNGNTEGIECSLDGNLLSVSPLIAGEYSVSLLTESNGREALIEIPVNVAKKIIIPSEPTNLNVEAGETTALITWTVSEGDVESYQILLNNDEIATTDQNSFFFENLSPLTEYRVSVISICINGEKGGESVFSFMTTDETAPLTVDNIILDNITESSAVLSWDEPYDNVGVAGYEIYLNEELVESSLTDPKYEFTELEPDTEYSFSVISFDKTGNKSEKTSINFTTLKHDEETTGISNINYNAKISLDKNELIISGCNGMYFTIFDINARCVDSFKVTEDTQSYFLNYKKGIYILKGENDIIFKITIR